MVKNYSEPGTDGQPVLTRRNLLLGASAAATVAAMPAIAAAALLPIPALPSMPMWAVGTIDNFDWEAVGAPTADEARRIWSAGYFDPCGNSDPECECDACYSFRGIEAERKPEWDGKGALTNADWIRADMMVPCSRCEEHCSIHEDAYPVGDEAVCLECMTFADWDVVDPVRAAEMREEAVADA